MTAASDAVGICVVGGLAAFGGGTRSAACCSHAANVPDWVAVLLAAATALRAAAVVWNWRLPAWQASASS